MALPAAWCRASGRLSDSATDVSGDPEHLSRFFSDSGTEETPQLRLLPIIRASKGRIILKGLTRGQPITYAEHDHQIFDQALH
jgi:hypothetical protein